MLSCRRFYCRLGADKSAGAKIHEDFCCVNEPLATKLEIKLFEERMPILADSKLQSDLLKASGVVGVFSDIFLESHAPCTKPNGPAKLF